MLKKFEMKKREKKYIIIEKKILTIIEIIEK